MSALPAVPTSDDVLDVAAVSVSFGGVQALSDVTFQVKRGELLGLIGPNGAGKTTMVRVISGQVAPDEGRIRLDRHDLHGLRTASRARRGLAMSHQIVRPFRNMSVLDNVALACGRERTRTPFSAITSVGRGDARGAAMAILARLGIAQAADRMPGTQPLGVLKRLEVARTLALAPSILLLDEPLAGLNRREAERLADTIRAVNEAGVTIVLIEHNLAEAQRICGRFVVLDNGRKIADGACAEVMRDAAVREAYLGRGWRDAHA